MEPSSPATLEINAKSWLARGILRRNNFLTKALPYLSRPGVRRWMQVGPFILTVALVFIGWRFFVDLFPCHLVRPSHAPTPMDPERFFILWCATFVYVIPALATACLYVAHILSNPALDGAGQTKWLLATLYGFPIGMPLYWRRHGRP